MTTKDKGRYYIWLSWIAFGLLWGDTTRKFRLFKGDPWIRFELWRKACGNMIKCCVLYLVLPIIIVGNVGALLLANILTDSLHTEIFMLILLAIIYFLGVYATNVHVAWRKKNLPLLSRKKDTK